jgi:hypothetical protein
MFQEVGAIAVDAQVAIGREFGGWVPAAGNGRAGEVKSIATGGEGDFNNIGVIDEDLVSYRTGCGDHWEIVILPEGLGQGVDEAGIKKRFVTLDVEDVAGVVELRRGLSDPVGTGGVLGSGEADFGSYGSCQFSNAIIIGCDDKIIEFLTLGSALEDVLKERLAKQGKEGLSGEAGGGPTGWNNSNDSTMFL